jgi:phosphoadenosine phosphosulfate reductase
MKLIWTKSLENKIKETLRLINWILSKEGPHAFLFSGSPASTFLLYMIREMILNENSVLVFHVDLIKNQLSLYQYLEKIVKLFGFDILRERNEYLIDYIETKGNWDEFYYCHTQKVMHNIAVRFKLKSLLLADHGVSKKEKCKEISLFTGFNLLEIRPLNDFKIEDVTKLIKINNLPFCPIFRKNFKIDSKDLFEEEEKFIRVWNTDLETEKKEIVSKLKNLGYL